MENQENNNLSELEQLKVEYETLKQRFDQQEIVNDRLMNSVIQTNTDFFAKYRKTVMIAYPALAAVGFLYYTLRGELWPFGIGFLLLLAAMIVAELWLTRNVRRQVMENADLMTLSKNMQKLKTGYAIYAVVVLILGFLFVSIHRIWNTVDQNVNIADFNITQYKDVAISIGFVGLLLFVLAYWAYRSFVSHCNEVIRQIDAIEGSQLSKKNRSFWVFLGVMVATFGAAVFLIYLALCPTVYERADNDLTSEGKLAIWEVCADTTLSAKDAYSLMEQWQNNDSLVFMIEKNPEIIMGMDGVSVHAWKEDNGLQVKLYTLKKTTPEGPAISSAVLGGKPVIQQVARESYRNGFTPMSVSMTPEAAQLWRDFTQRADSIGPFRGAVSLDGFVYQEWTVMSRSPNGSFFILKKWRKDELDAFCKRLIKQ